MAAPARLFKVLVSGASGFIAVWVVQALLERGHHVRGTVRSVAKGEYLKRLFAEHGDRFEYVIVEDLERVRVPRCMSWGADDGYREARSTMLSREWRASFTRRRRSI